MDCTTPSTICRNRERQYRDMFAKAPADLVFDTRILSLCIFSNENGVNVVVRGLVSFDRQTWSDVGEEVERTA